MTRSRFGALPWLGPECLVILLDQLTKLYFQANLSLYQKVPVIPDILSWTLAYNPAPPSASWPITPAG